LRIKISPEILEALKLYSLGDTSTSISITQSKMRIKLSPELRSRLIMAKLKLLRGTAAS
jgi:hypothetical protein